jgi:crossover junction endodeoxyribonuclease RusA
MTVYRLPDFETYRKKQAEIDARTPSAATPTKLIVGPSQEGAVGSAAAHIYLSVPWPPTANSLYRPGKKGKDQRYLTDEQKAFRQAVAGIVLERRCKALTGRLAVEISAFPPDARRRDLDNIIKPTLDALQHAGCFADDNQIDRIEIMRVKGSGVGILNIIVRKICHE